MRNVVPRLETFLPQPPVNASALRAPMAALACGLLLLLGCAPSDPLETVRAQHAEGNYEASIETLRAQIDEDPGRSQAHLLLGVALLRTGQAGSAIWPLRAAVSDPNLAVEAGLLLTEATLQSRFKDEAIAAANAVLEIEPDNISALEMRIDAYLDAGRNDDVLEEISGVLELDPENKTVLVPRIIAYLALEQEEEAAEALGLAQEGLKKEPGEEEPGETLNASRARLCVVTGMFAFERGDQEAADTHYAQCLEDHPVHPLVVQEAVIYYHGTGRAERATEILVAALEQEPSSLFRTRLAQRMNDLGDLEEAERLYREDAEESSSPNAWFILGDHYVRRDMLSQAVDAFQEAVNAGPEPAPMVVFAHADTLIQVDRLQEARDAAQKLEGTPLGDLIEGRVLASEGKWEEALATFEKGIQLWPNNPGARFLAGETAEKLGRFDEAVSHYRESIRADKSFTDSALRLALLQEAQGMDLQALDRMGHFVRAKPDDPEGYVVTIRLADRVGQREIVRQALGRLARIPGQQGVALSLSANLIARRTGIQESISLIEKAPVDLTEPENSDALAVLVRNLIQAKRPEEAQTRLLKAIEAHPEHADFHRLLGLVLEAREAPRERVVSAYQRAAELDPQNAAALTALGRLNAEAELYAEALDAYDRASQADPLKPGAAVASLLLMRDRANLAERQARAEELLLRHPYSAAIASELAQIIAQGKQDPQRALAPAVGVRSCRIQRGVAETAATSSRANPSRRRRLTGAGRWRRGGPWAADPNQRPGSVDEPGAGLYCNFLSCCDPACV